MKPTSRETIFQLKISLKGAKPPIWRRVLVPGDTTFAVLHDIVQYAMGWHHVHLHEFRAGDMAIGSPVGDSWHELVDEREVRLNDVARNPKDRITYAYDFGDDWVHDIVVEKLLPRDNDTFYPVCIKGKRACPPEDVGGIWGYADFLHAYFDPEHPDHADMVDWAGAGFDPEWFDIERVNALLTRVGQEDSPAQADAGQSPLMAFSADPIKTSPGRRSTESALRKITQLLEGQNLDSIEDIDAFLNKTLSEGSIDELVPDTVEDQAMALLDEAYETEDSQKRVALASQVLNMCPTCVEAYIVLAEEAEDPDESIRLLEKGVQVAAETLGPKTFDEEAGHFWGILSTRPYVRVRKALADVLWAYDHMPEAIAHAEDLLRLNTNDNMGIRYDLLFWYLTVQDTDRASELLKRFDEDIGCFWPLGKALWRFQTEGGSQRAKRELNEAFMANEHLIGAFVEADEIDIPPAHYIVGSADEAIHAVFMSFQSFAATEGALHWLFDHIEEMLTGAQRRVGPKVGRNDPCPCGSGIKYKRCCGRK